MDALKETELNKAFLESIYNMYERNINVFVFDAPCWIDGFPYSKSALRRKKMGVEASFPQMVKDIIKWESDLKEIFQEKYSVEYVKKIRNSVKTIKVSGKYVREDYISELINYIGGKRVTCYQPQEYSKTLHIYGRCIVTGTFVEDADTFPSRFQKLLTDHGHSDIRVVNHGIPGDPERVMMKHNIIMDSPDYKDDDIVMIMDDWHKVKKTLESINVQVTDLSAHWPVNDITVSQFFHNPVHMGYKGYDLLAGIVYKIFIDNFGKKGEGIYKIKKPTDYPFSMKKYIAAEETEKDIEKGVSEYTGKILRDHPLTESIKKIGAVVMNCNPFTFGHRHLIEYASKNVDRLYVFCVEEDRSFFRFEDRIDMIRKGTSDLKNVIVIPSGRFIISTTTFPEYFEKENIEDEKVDVTEDLTIFCKKIAPKLGITKRFAGEEPFDPVTGQYNEKMREMLPENGLEFEAIPRKRSEGSDVISATTVRQLMAQKEYEKLLSLVPETTYDIIMDKYVYQKKTKITEKEMIIRDRSIINPKVSVVIPMYNCEQFVHDLLKMFSEQSFTDFEVICVIDGATDGTEEAVKEYCKTDDRFRYVVRENGGAGAARNTGIDEAKGKYVIFSDADDIYDKDYLLKLYNSAESLNTDITVCGNIIFDHQTGEIRQVKSFDKESIFEGEVYSSKRIKRIFRKIGVHISNKLFRLDFIKKNALKFSETKTSNDLFFSKASVICAGRISVVHDDLLTIRRHINERSITSNRTANSINALTELQKLYNWMEEKDMLGTIISDYMWLFDVTVNYEMKNGLNPDFIERFVKIINCDRPWIYLKGEQISIVLNNCLGKNGNEEIKKVEKDILVDDKERLQKFNEVSEFRNNNKKRMQEMAKETSLRLFNRDLDDPESESPYKDHNGEYEIQKASDNTKNIGETMIPEISVIIPMYNCEVFVNDCLDMFSNQTFRDLEVICVIDGATDKTEEKVKDYSKKDPRISYICQTNGGAGSARNTGLDRAKGRYIIFADADDEYSEDYLKKLYETAINHDAQVVVCSFGRCDTNLQNNMKVLGFNKKIFFENIIYSHRGIDDLFNAVQPRITNRLYNTKFVKENKLRFSETRISNDTFFGCASLSIADRILFVHDSLLTYRVHINADSLTDKRVRFLHEAIIVLKELYNWLKDRSLMDIHGEDYYRRTDHVLYLDGARGATPRFISDFAHMLNAEEPWDRMTSGEILEFLKRSILVEDDIRKESEINCLSSELLESDPEIGYLVEQCRNRIQTARLLRQVSLERYGRDFDVKDSLPGKKSFVKDLFRI